MSCVLVVAAHPDDAELAVGGTIAGLTDLGIDVIVAFATVSEPDSSLRPHRIAAAERAAKVLGHRIHWMADGEHDQVEDMPEYEVVRRVDALVEAVRPRAVVTHWEGDSHSDHVRIARAVMSSSRRWPDASLLQFGPNEYRTVRHSEFVPNVYVPIADQLARKTEAVAQYGYLGQGFQKLNTDTVELIARANGVAIGVAAAEALQLRRQRLDLKQLGGQ